MMAHQQDLHVTEQSLTRQIAAPQAGEATPITGDSQTRLAWERTHLSWVRTATNVVALGLAVAKLSPDGSGTSAAAVIVVTGLALLIYSTRRYHRQVPSGTGVSGPVAATGALATALLTASALLACGTVCAAIPHV